jgi:transcription initiation factor IIE alpha subunit
MNYAMQTRCYHCKEEQYALAVYSLSTEGGECPKCGEHIEPMTQEEYKKRLKDETTS